MKIEMQPFAYELLKVLATSDNSVKTISESTDQLLYSVDEVLAQVKKTGDVEQAYALGHQDAMIRLAKDLLRSIEVIK